MRKKTLNKAKLEILVESNKDTQRIATVSVFDRRTQEYWTKDRIHERGIDWFLDMDDMKQTLNWNLNGDDSKYQFKWGQSAGGKSSGVAYVFD